MPASLSCPLLTPFKVLGFGLRPLLMAPLSLPTLTVHGITGSAQHSAGEGGQTDSRWQGGRVLMAIH